MKIFLTGATGFIGRAFCQLAVERGHELLALCRQPDPQLPSDVEVARGTLETTPWPQVESFAPDAALHLAWVATPGVYLTSPENDVWLEQSKAWFLELQRLGVPHLAGTGTCIEYAPSVAPLHEQTSPLAPSYPYSRAKAALFDWMAKELSTPWSWFRIFYPYGPGEHPQRLCSSLIRQLQSGQSLSLRTPASVKDYIFIDDLARALCMALEAQAQGPINIGTGQGIAIEDLARLMAQHLRADINLVQRAHELAHDPTPIVVADTTALQSLGWAPQVTLDAGLQRLIDSLSAASYEPA